VRKFTEEVPREKVLVIEDVMDASTKENVGDLKVSKDDIIENVAEKILTQEKIVGVVDSENRIVGSIKPSKIIDTVFGGRRNS
jgi:glycine betaine/proline transport system ATP-binding protein